jgi:peptidoglycan/xylan/chitin deacetylase (PgdA/CDA1 family)
VVTRILTEGHELGNHTWSHIDLPALPPGQMFEEIQKCAAVLQRETGSISRWFRPSQTDVPDAAILEQAGRVGYATSVGYDIDPLDYTDPGAALVESRVRAGLHGGAIVSLHTLYAGTATAFTPIVAAIRARGLEPVTTSAVLA